MSLRPSSQCAVTRGEGKDLLSPGCVEEERERETYMGEAKFDRLYFCYAPEVMWNEGGRRLLFIESCRLYNQSSFKPKVDAAT